MMLHPPLTSNRPLRCVGIAEMATSSCPEDLLVTYSLGSCVGVTVHDPLAGVGGLIHCMLPQCSLDAQKGQDRPCMFVDSGVSLLLGMVFGLGAARSRLSVKLAGGASLFDDRGLFRIGDRNLTMVRKILWKNDLLLASWDVGGTKARTLYLDLGSGKTLVRSGSETVEL